MNVSLRHFLKTGYLGLLRTGLSADEVQAVLGPTEHFAKSFRKYRSPDIWLYGGVEVWLDQSTPQLCRGLWIERQGHGWKDEFRMPVGSVVEDWDLQPYLPRDKVENYLRHNDIPTFQPEPAKVGKQGVTVMLRHLVVRTSRITLGFDEEWRLNAFHAQPAETTSLDIL